MSETTDNKTYSSWISLVEDAEKTMNALNQRTSLVTIGDSDDVSEKSVIIFDTSVYDNQ